MADQPGGNHPIEDFRNFGVIAHIDAGKTTLTEVIGYHTKVTHKMGAIHEGTCLMDSMKQEQKRGITITAAAITTYWECDGTEAKLNLIDTPGHVDFTVEVERSMRVLDGAVVCLDGGEGVEPQTCTVWNQADKWNVPRIVIVNKMDKVGADFARCIDQIKDNFGVTVAAVQLPIGASESFVGVIDLLERQELVWSNDDPTGGKFDRRPVSAERHDEVEAARAQLVETIVETDDELIAIYLDGKEISPVQLRTALRKATIARKLVPVLCGSAWKRKGVQPLLDAIVRYLPSPKDVEPAKGKLESGEMVARQPLPTEPLTVFAFKIVDDPDGDITYVRNFSGVLSGGSYVLNARTGRQERVQRLVRMMGPKLVPIDELGPGDLGGIRGLKDTETGDTLCALDNKIELEAFEFEDPVMALAIAPADKSQQEKLSAQLDRMRRADPSFRVHTDRESGEVIISGVGELQLEVKIELLRERGITVIAGKPKVNYREKIAGRAREDYTHKKQSGGHGQFARVVIEIEPSATGEFVFENKIVGGTVPTEFIPAVEKGIESMLEKGPLAKYPVLGVKVSLVDGKSHDVDSSAMAFETAARDAFRAAFQKAQPVLLEPIMLLNAKVSQDYVGDIMGDVGRRQGKVLETGVMADGKTNFVKAEIPLRETFGYAKFFRSTTSGKGDHSLKFARYDVAPKSVQDEVVAERNAK